MNSEVCTCPIKPGMTYEELTNEILIPELYCTSLRVSDKGWICETFQKELEAAKVKVRYQKTSKKAQKQRKLAKAKELAAKGLSRDEIVKELKAIQPKQRRRHSVGPRKIRRIATDFGSF